MDFLTQRGLIAECGHSPHHWPLVALKELVDNALDACEDHGVAPEIQVAVDDDGIVVSDNGPGIPPKVVNGVLDFQKRVSTREAYVGPTRGAQGNALKTLVALPFVLSGDVGRVTITSCGIRHEITLTKDQIRQEPVINCEQHVVDPATKGATVRIYWPKEGSVAIPGRRKNGGAVRSLSSCFLLNAAKEKFLQLADDYAFLNPHLSLSVDWRGDRLRIPAPQPGWRKWTARDAAPPHWYDEERFERLIGACISHDTSLGVDRTIREFVSGFRGLSGSKKPPAVLEACGLSGAKLSQLVEGSEINHDLVRRLLDAMKQEGKAVAPASLGILGSEHLAARFALLCDMRTFKYKKVEGTHAGVPWVLETAFAWDPEAVERRLITGVNWSPCIQNPFRELQEFGGSLDSILADQRAGADEPIVLLLHLVHARAQFTDRGKTSLVFHGG
jgi:hypothetical protein